MVNLTKLAKERQRLLQALADVLHTLALVLEAEEQTSQDAQQWTHRDRKAISSLVANMCRSRLISLSWVDTAVSRLTKLRGGSGSEF